MQKTIGFLTAALVIVTALSGCARTEVLHKDDNVTVTREGKYITVRDNVADANYNFAIARVRRGSTPTGRRTLVQTPTMAVATAGGTLIIQPHGGETVVIAFSLRGRR